MVHESLREVVNGGAGDFAGLLRALTEISWTGITLRSVLESTP